MKTIIATLLRAGRPDLVDALMTAKLGYWEQHYRQLDGQVDTLQRRVRFFARELQKRQGNGIAARKLTAAATKLDQVRDDIKVLREFRTPSVPHAA